VREIADATTKERERESKIHFEYRLYIIPITKD